MSDKILECAALAMILSAVTLFAAVMIAIWVADPGDLAWQVASTALITFLMAYAATIVVIELEAGE